MTYKIYGLKVYTKTTYEKMNGKYIPKMLGVIEGPIHHMLKHFPNEFNFIRHESKRSLRPSAKGRASAKGGKNNT